MSALLHDVLRPHGVDVLADRLAKAQLTRSEPSYGEEDDEELVGVTSLPGTPARSRPSSRPPSPTRGARARSAPGPLLLGQRHTDPIRAFPTELSQRIFARLSLRDLARCTVVCKKWNKSQTLNYVWFQHYRKEAFHDDSLPAGKWTRRESKQNWRHLVKQALEKEAPVYSRPISQPQSGWQTPKEIREERWRTENDAVAAPSKLEMRDMYKALGGRKMKGKGKINSSMQRDRGGWTEGGDE